MLERSLTYHLASLAEDGIGPAEALFKQRFGLDVHELRVLRLVGANPRVTFTDLARATKFERSATSRILTRLIRSGLVLRVNSAADARRYELTITAKGEALRKLARPLSIELETLMLEPLSAAERTQFLAMLDRLRNWVGSGYKDVLEHRYPLQPPAAGKPRRAASPQPRAPFKGRAP